MIHKRSRLINVLYALIGLGIVVISLILYWLFVPLRVLEINQQPVPVEPTQVRAGEFLVLKYSYCKYSGDRGRIRPSIIGPHTSDSPGKEEFLATYEDPTSVSCRDNLEAPTKIPRGTLPGAYHFHYRATYHPNPLREVVVEWDSQPFEVVP